MWTLTVRREAADVATASANPVLGESGVYSATFEVNRAELPREGRSIVNVWIGELHVVALDVGPDFRHEASPHVPADLRETEKGISLELSSKDVETFLINSVKLTGEKLTSLECSEADD